MRLIPVDPGNPRHLEFLYELLTFRPDVARISSKAIPLWGDHVEFVRNHPYADWSLIEVNLSVAAEPWPALVGAVTLTQPARPSIHGDELGVDILPQFRDRGYATEALQLMMAKHGRRRYLAHIGMRNYRSMALFQELGFTPCQMTFEFNHGAPVIVHGIGEEGAA